MSSEARFHLASRMPVDPETNGLALTSRGSQTPKWYQFIPRSLLSRTWLDGFLPPDSGQGDQRKAIIIADEGGVGKTKAGALAINHHITSNPHQSVALLVPMRLIDSWRDELLSVNRSLRGRIVWGTGSARQLKHVEKNRIYLVSKDSFRKHWEDIKHTWKEQEPKVTDPFSLVVVDEAHRGKGGKHANDEETLNADSSQMYAAISELCKAYAAKTIGITASPLSMQLSEIHNIAKMLDVHPNLYNHIPLDLSEDEEKETLYEWAEYSVEIDGFIGKFSNGQADEEKSIIELHEFFADSDNKLVSLLPCSEAIRKAFSGVIDPGWYDADRRMAWLHDLKPLSPFLSKISRDDLGEASNTMFRECITWTEFVPLNEEHHQRLKDSDGYGNMGGTTRQMQEWPTNPDRQGIYGFQTGHSIFDKRLENDTFLEPRLRRLVESIFPADPVLSGNFEGNKGALVFCFYKRTVRILQTLLDKHKFKRLDGSEIEIQCHGITGDNEDAMANLKEIASTREQERDVYHVVVGTSAIQEGISMNWATTIVHWDLPTNPQTLEQRTWRLDRHRTEVDADQFHVVYLVTDSDSDANIVKILHLRSQLADLILNFGNIDDKKWPQTFDETKERSDAHVREYGEAIQAFIHAEAQQLARSFGHSVEATSTAFNTRMAQQKALFGGLFNRNGLRLDSDAINDGVLSLAVEDGGVEELHRMMNMANGEDLRVLQKCFPTPPGARKNQLRIDGTPAEDGSPTGRRYALALDPRGALIQRLLRRTPCSSFLQNNEERYPQLVFSIELEHPVRDSLYEFGKVWERVFGLESHLFLAQSEQESAARHVKFEQDEDLLERMMNEANTVSDHLSPAETEALNTSFHQVVEQLLEELERQLNTLESEIERTQERGRTLSPNSPEEEWLKLNLERKLRRLEEQSRELEKVETELNDRRSSYRPVLRYAEGRA